VALSTGWLPLSKGHVNDLQANPQAPVASRLPLSGAAARLTRVAATPSEPTAHFEEVARAEAERLRVRILELEARAEQWAARQRELTAEVERLGARLRNLDELLGTAPQLRLDLQTRELQGQQLREEAIRILLAKRGARQPIHYREWYALLREEGIAATGKDPLATFLTQLTRSPIVERVDGPSGIYLVDPANAYRRARQELAGAVAELTAAQEALVAGESAETIAAVRDAQTALAAAQRRLDMTLAARAAALLRQPAAA
jgi:hypothetical protein